MKKTFIIVTSVIIFLFGCSEDKKIIDKNVFESNGVFSEDINHQNLFTGTAYSHDELIKISIKDGLKNGEIIYYYPTEVSKTKEISLIAKKGYYLDNILDGEWTEYYENGKIKSKITYKNGVRLDNKLEFDTEGNQIVKTQFVSTLTNNSHNIIKENNQNDNSPPQENCSNFKEKTAEELSMLQHEDLSAVGIIGAMRSSLAMWEADLERIPTIEEFEKLVLNRLKEDPNYTFTYKGSGIGSVKCGSNRQYLSSSNYEKEIEFIYNPDFSKNDSKSSSISIRFLNFSGDTYDTKNKLWSKY